MVTAFLISRGLSAAYSRLAIRYSPFITSAVLDVPLVNFHKLNNAADNIRRRGENIPNDLLDFLRLSRAQE